MGASAIRLVIAEIAPNRSIRTIEEASRGVLLGRDTFSSGAIRSQTVDAAFGGARELPAHHRRLRRQQVRAVATSAVREARNGDLFLDRIRRRTGIAFEIINEAEESRLVFLAVRHARPAAPPSAARGRCSTEVGGGSTSLTLLRQGSPIVPGSTRWARSGSASSSTCGG